MNSLAVFRHNLNSYNIQLAGRVERGVRVGANFIHRESLKRVPRDTDALADSSRVRQEGFGFDAQFVVGYGAYDFVESRWSPAESEFLTRRPADYAVFVHQIRASHPIGDWKYLERAVLEEIGGLIATMEIQFSF